MSDYFICPVCGADVPTDALACPECGSDEDTGWSEDTAYDGQNDLVLCYDSQRSKSSTKPEGTDITHKYIGGVGIIPEKSQRCAENSSTDHCQLTGSGDKEDLKVLGKTGVSRYVY